MNKSGVHKITHFDWSFYSQFQTVVFQLKYRDLKNTIFMHNFAEAVKYLQRNRRSKQEEISDPRARKELS